jgi:hypothetical protein
MIFRSMALDRNEYQSRIQMSSRRSLFRRPPASRVSRDALATPQLSVANGLSSG